MKKTLLSRPRNFFSYFFHHSTLFALFAQLIDCFNLHFSLFFLHRKKFSVQHCFLVIKKLSQHKKKSERMSWSPSSLCDNEEKGECFVKGRLFLKCYWFFFHFFFAATHASQPASSSLFSRTRAEFQPFFNFRRAFFFSLQMKIDSYRRTRDIQKKMWKKRPLQEKHNEEKLISFRWERKQNTKKRVES